MKAATLKRKLDPTSSPASLPSAKRFSRASSATNFQAQLSAFEVASRRRESLRFRTQAATAPSDIESGLKSRVAVEMALIEGTAKFIMACKNQSQVLEAAKTLLVARLRADMLKFELNKLRRGRGSPTIKVDGKPSYGGVSLSGIRIPLMWKRKDHINDAGDSRRFAVFCLARIGSQIYASTLLKDVDRNQTDIGLPDAFLFSKVPPYFELTLEVYAHLIQGETSPVSVTATPQKICRSIGKAVGKKLLLTGSTSKDFENIGPKFHLLASATLSLDHCSEDTQCQELYIVEPSGVSEEQQLPLFSDFCCRLAAQPYCIEEEVLCGRLVLKRKAKMETFWASIVGWRLQLWTEKDHKDAKECPVLEIPITRDTSIRDKGPDTLVVANTSFSWEFFFEDKENLHLWLVHLIQHAGDHRRWKTAAVERMQILSPQQDLDASKRMRRTRSKLMLLYDQAGIEASPEKQSEELI